jgi:UDP-glucuronate decarboxylase
MRNIVVTGGAGFLGRHICERMLDLPEVHVFCIDNLITGYLKNISEFQKNSRFSFIEHDITQELTILVEKGILPSEIDSIYHLACIASPPVYKEYSIETLMTSFVGTKSVLDLARKTKAKVLFTSTSEVYGDPEVHPQPEEYFGNVNTVGERSCYDEGKRVAESLIYEYRRKYNLDLKIVRIFNTYGPYMDINDGRVITNFIKQIMSDKPLIIYGDGSQGRSFCYVDDMVDGLIAMMNSKEQGPVNIGNPYNEFTLNELVQEFEMVVDRQLSVKFIEATENDPKQRKPDITKANSLLSWQPKIKLEQGIKKTMLYFKKLNNKSQERQVELHSGE